MDKDMLLTFYNFTKKNKVFRRLTELIYCLSAPFFFVVYFTFGIYLCFADINGLIVYLGAPALTLVISRLLRGFIKRRRPYDALGLTPPVNKRNRTRASYSCPSNHASSASVIALAIMSVNQGFGTAVFIFAVITGLSRVAAGVHYPSDILISFALSASISLIVFNLHI